MGMGLGGALSALLGKRSPEMMCWMLSFAGGVMISIVGFELIPGAIELSGTAMTITGLIIGVCVVMALNRVVDKFSLARGHDDSLRIHHTHEELYHEGGILNSKALLRSGVIMLVAIALHNLPEGVAIGAAGSFDARLGFTLALMIALHNIPEGMAIAAPLIGGGIGKGKAVTLTALSGAPTFIGAAFGILIGGVSNTALCLSLAAAGGAMLYVVFGEIIPQSVVMTKSRFTSIITLFGIIVGLLITRI
ncbi:MAG: ZIP family metal transporter [Defluviitaleaceae bacterium]|nr:ZIP family metal transporter [Defluviitaleaceae bacterium]